MLRETALPECHSIVAVNNSGCQEHFTLLSMLAGSYLLKQHLLIHDMAITVKGEGVGLSKLIWAEDAASVGMVICQGAQQNNQTDFTRVQHLSFYTRQKDVGEG